MQVGQGDRRRQAALPRVTKTTVLMEYVRACITGTSVNIGVAKWR